MNENGGGVSIQKKNKEINKCTTDRRIIIIHIYCRIYDDNT